MKPGITGLWQLAGNGEVADFEDVVKLDCDYIDNWSLWLDLQILAKTVVKVVKGTGW
jgi:lipopolysaccharide/colanic/teichoic acid biosynthesis glycosyltransferase